MSSLLHTLSKDELISLLVKTARTPDLTLFTDEEVDKIFSDAGQEIHNRKMEKIKTILKRVLPQHWEEINDITDVRVEDEEFEGRYEADLIIEFTRKLARNLEVENGEDEEYPDIETKTYTVFRMEYTPPILHSGHSMRKAKDTDPWNVKFFANFGNLPSEVLREILSVKPRGFTGKLE